jgi:NAD(P)-dependent dehydrogenase (short-subunit alcohol dehydrogenase family)
MSVDDVVGLRVLVTGGASGIGHAVAAAAVRRGATVSVLDLDPSTAPAGVDAISAALRRSLWLGEVVLDGATIGTIAVADVMG